MVLIGSAMMRRLGLCVCVAGAVLVTSVPGLAANPPQVAAKPGAAAKPVPAAPAPPAAGPAAPGYEIESAAQYLDFLFGEACLPNYQSPEKVRAYALSKHLVEITSPQALALYVGQGGGAAWEVNVPLGHFVLSIRGPTQGCAIWARQAEPLGVETYFRARVEQLTKPKTEAFLDRDRVIQSAAGDMRAVLYTIADPYADESIELIMLSLDNSGAMFQASYQIAKKGKRVPPPP